jgi:hypothetical protein
MSDSHPGWHEAENEGRHLNDGLTLTQKCLLHMAIVRDFRLTPSETLAKLHATDRSGS